MENENFVTLPSLEEAFKLSIGQSDYARDMGALSEIWTRDSLTAPAGLITCRYTNKGVKAGFRYANDTHVGVAPRFENPKDKHLSLMRLRGHKRKVIAIDGKPVYYPQTRLDQLTEGVATCLYQANDIGRLIKVGEFTQIVGYDYENKRFILQPRECFNIFGQNVMRVPVPKNNHWYICEPIEAVSDQALQCTNSLMPAPVDDLHTFNEKNQNVAPEDELNMRNLALGVFMNQQLFPELIASTHFPTPNQELKYNSIGVAFSSSHLKHAVRILDEADLKQQW